MIKNMFSDHNGNQQHKDIWTILNYLETKQFILHESKTK